MCFRPLTDSDIPDTITASNYLLLAGGTMTGNILMPASSYLNSRHATDHRKLLVLRFNL